MSIISTSYEFHKRVESPVAFVRREWQSLAVFGGGFAAVLLVGILAVDPAYFYPRLATDPLLYYMKGLAFAETGHTAARAAINRPPFQYVAMPGVLRSPFMMAFRDFDTQLRAIQLSNILLVGATAVLYAYILSWAIPRRWHWLGVAFSFAFMLLSPHWVVNVFAPLADAPYAFFTIVCVVLAARLLPSDRPLRRRPLAMLVVALCFAVAFLIRFTAPVLLAYAIALRAGRSREHRHFRKLVAVETVVAAAAVAVLAVLNWQTIRSRYLYEPYFFLTRASKPSMVMNLLASALPSQIVADFRLGFARPSQIGNLEMRFGHSAPDVALISFGIVISATIFVGMWRSRDRFAPEIAYALAALPLLTLMMPSTARYLMAYQPFLWIFFYAGVSLIFAPVARGIAATRKAPFVGLALLLACGSGLVYLRSRRVAGTLAERSAAISIGESRAYVGEVASTFRALRNFLETLPRDRALLVGSTLTTGRWKVISGLDYYRPDSALSVAVASRETYLVVECGTVEVCQDFKNWDAKSQKDLDYFGAFTFEPVFTRITRHAKVRVYRIRNASD